MRNKKRIPIITKVLVNNDNKRKVLEYWFKPKVGVQLEMGMPYLSIDDYVNVWDKHYNLFKQWKKNTELRLSQILITTEILPNIKGFWYQEEDEKVMIESGVLEAREILFWKNSLDENNKLLKKTNIILIKNMTTNHIRNILKLDSKIEKIYIETFKKELEIRKERS